MVDRVRLVAEDAYINPDLSGSSKPVRPVLTIQGALELMILQGLFQDEIWDKKKSETAHDKAKSFLKKVKNDSIKGPLKDRGSGCIFDKQFVDLLLRPIFADMPQLITLSLATFLGGVDFDVLLAFLKEKPTITRLIVDPGQFHATEEARFQQVIISLGRKIELGEIPKIPFHNPFVNNDKLASQARVGLVRMSLQNFLRFGNSTATWAETFGPNEMASKAEPYLRKNDPYYGPLKDFGKGCILDQQCVDGLLNRIFDDYPDFFVFTLRIFQGKVDFVVLENFLKVRRNISWVTYKKDQFSAEDFARLKHIVASLNSERRLLQMKEV